MAKVEYVLPEARTADFKRAYESGLRSLDILHKLRAAGMPNAEGEAKAERLLESVRRLAASFNVDLGDLS
jgi:hypothetical protein